MLHEDSYFRESCASCFIERNNTIKMTKTITAGFAVLYRWKLHEGKEQDFIATWTRISELLYELHGSLGSRLHRSPDDIWYSYAQWPSAEARLRAFEAPLVDPEASALQKTCVAEYFPEIVLEPVSDLMVLPVTNHVQ